MNQNVIEKFNACTADNDVAYDRACAAGFPWLYFMDRAQGKARASGYLPESGQLLFEARYVNSADQVVKAVFAGIESVGDAHTLVGWCTPWLDTDIQRWKEVICSLSCTAFDAGVVAAFTKAHATEEDPIVMNGAWSIFGDVGFMGLRTKSLALVGEVGGEEAKTLMGEIGDCSCLHVFADRTISDRVFKSAAPIREAYVRNACKAAYLAGAVFGEKLLGAVRSGRGDSEFRDHE